MDVLGDQYHTHITGLTHDPLAHPSTVDPKIHARLVKRLYEKILESSEDITLYREINTEDCEILLVCYGICTKTCQEVVRMSMNGATRKKYGMLQLRTLWPFPKDLIYDYANRVDKIISVELSHGQMVHKIYEYAQGLCDVSVVSKIGGELITPKEILRPKIIPVEYGSG